MDVGCHTRNCIEKLVASKDLILMNTFLDKKYSTQTTPFKCVFNLACSIHPIQDKNKRQIFQNKQVEVHSLTDYKIDHQIPHISGRISSHFLSTILYGCKQRWWEVLLCNHIWTIFWNLFRCRTRYLGISKIKNWRLY